MSKLLNIELANAVSQSVAVNGNINLGSIVRKYCCCQAGTQTFTAVSGGQTLGLNQPGYYSIDVHAVATVPTAGTATIALYNNSVSIPYASSSETFATASTESHTLSLSTTVRVLPNSPVTLSLVNTGVASTVTLCDIKAVKIV